MTAPKTAPKAAQKKTAAAAKPKRAAAPPRSPASKPAPTPAAPRSTPASPSSKAAPDTRREPKRPRREVLSAEPAVVAQIRELEAQLDRLIDEASRHDVSSLDPEDDDTSHDEHDFDAEATLPVARSLGAPPRDAPAQSSTAIAAELRSGLMPEPRPSAPVPEPRFSEPRPSGPLSESRESRSTSQNVPLPPESVFDTARELLSSDFYLRKWGKLAMRGRSEEVDDFGFDPIYDAKLKTVLDFLYTKYFRVETTGIASVPPEGRCLLVANHSGTLPLDGLMLKAAVKREQSASRDVRWLTEDFIYHMPFLGGAMNRLGAVRACQENAERLLAKEQLVAVFPEGVKGIGKLFAERYRLQRFGRGGFIKLCLRTGTPIVPVAVTGAEETNPLLFKIEHLSKALGVPYVPVTPTFPLLGPLGLLPAPTKWRIQFGEPLDLSAHGPEAADDEILVGKLAERVRATIQGMLDRSVGSRKSVFFG
jgi:1-acyl-sn-glycerol-3-phosphate acyltransferase